MPQEDEPHRRNDHVAPPATAPTISAHIGANHVPGFANVDSEAWILSAPRSRSPNGSIIAPKSPTVRTVIFAASPSADAFLGGHHPPTCSRARSITASSMVAMPRSRAYFSTFARAFLRTKNGTLPSSRSAPAPSAVHLRRRPPRAPRRRPRAPVRARPRRSGPVRAGRTSRSSDVPGPALACG